MPRRRVHSCNSSLFKKTFQNLIDHGIRSIDDVNALRDSMKVKKISSTRPQIENSYECRYHGFVQPCLLLLLSYERHVGLSISRPHIVVAYEWYYNVLGYVHYAAFEITSVDFSSELPG